MNPLDLLARLGRWAMNLMRGLGHSAFFFVDLLKALPPVARRL